MAAERCWAGRFGHGRAGSLADVHVCPGMPSGYGIRWHCHARARSEAGRTQRAGGAGPTGTAL